MCGDHLSQYRDAAHALLTMAQPSQKEKLPKAFLPPSRSHIQSKQKSKQHGVGGFSDEDWSGLNFQVHSTTKLTYRKLPKL